MADGDITSADEAMSLAGVSSVRQRKPWVTPAVRKLAEPPADDFSPENEG